MEATHGPDLDPGVPQLLVSRQAPHVVLAATPAWLAGAGFAEQDVVGHALALLLQGDGTCMVTAGALWSALQVSRSHSHETSTVSPPCLSGQPHRPLGPPVNFRGRPP